jgi:REP element-mobilizing transposase RayT
MAQSLAQIYLHIVFSTKHRYPYLQEPALRFQMHAYLAGICKNLESPSLLIGGVEDHVHILCRPSKNLAVADLLRELKRDSSNWIKERAPALSEFHWQAGYGVFSIRASGQNRQQTSEVLKTSEVWASPREFCPPALGPAHVDLLKAYIAKQEEHHRRESFQDEFRRLCRKYGVEIDERYVWD